MTYECGTQVGNSLVLFGRGSGKIGNPMSRKYLFVGQSATKRTPVVSTLYFFFINEKMFFI